MFDIYRYEFKLKNVHFEIPFDYQSQKNRENYFSLHILINCCKCCFPIKLMSYIKAGYVFRHHINKSESATLQNILSKKIYNINNFSMAHDSFSLEVSIFVFLHAITCKVSFL